jgi:hypothetical protein
VDATANASNARTLKSSHPRGLGLGGVPGRRFGAAQDAAVVVTETVSVTVPDPLGVTEGGLTVQVASEGAPVQAKLMAWFMPPKPPILRV